MQSQTDICYNLSIKDAAHRLRNIVLRTPLQYNQLLSKKYECNIFFKREDLQEVRSYKLRGAYNMMSQLPAEMLNNGVACASAGNHAQGFAYSCKKLNAKGVVFMPKITPKQKITQTKMFGEDFIEVRLVGDTFDDCAIAAKQFCEEKGMTFIPPFDDIRIIEGQGTVAVEILEQLQEEENEFIINNFRSQTSTVELPTGRVDFLFLPVGGGGLSAGVGSYFKTYSPLTIIIGVEPEGAPSMFEAMKAGHPVELKSIDRFVDGAAVKRVGDITFPICKEVIDEIHLVPEGKICTTILKLYNEEAIVVEPAGAMSIAALDDFANDIKGKNVVCIVSGSNNDIDRMQEIKEKSLQYEGLKHYFLINFAQRAGALKEFVNNVLGPTDDITRFEYMQKTNKENGPALVGIELLNRADYDMFLNRLDDSKFSYSEINKDDQLFGYLI